MRWGTELWDKFEDVSNYVNKGVEFCEKYEEFWKKRCIIENTYARSIKKLIESYEPKKKDQDQENNSSCMKCFVNMLSELRDLAGQHELIAENVQESILNKFNQTLKVLKEERKKCIEDKERYLAEHLAYDELLEKCKQKYERAFKEVERAEELLVKVENDDSASKNDIKKQKSVCDQKRRQLDVLEAEYAKQLCEANRIKNKYYYEQLPSTFDVLQGIENKRINCFREILIETVKAEIEVLPRIKQCLNEIDDSAKSINPDNDTELAVKLFKTGYQIPSDHVFEDLKQPQNQSINNISENGITALGQSNSSFQSRQKKYRTLSRIKGLFLATSTKSEPDSLLDLPPEQFKNEIIKKISSIQAEIEKQKKEREGLLKLKEIYSKNQKFGDSQSAEAALKSNEEKLNMLMNSLDKYQETYTQFEQKGNHNSNASPQPHQHQQVHYFECSSNESCSTHSNGSSSYNTTNGICAIDSTSNRRNSEIDSNSKQHIYHSPNRNVTSLSSMPFSATKTDGANVVANGSAMTNAFNTVAYAVSSPLSNTTSSSSKIAPLVKANNNESFDEGEDEEIDEIDDGCYEVVNRNIQQQVTQQETENINSTSPDIDPIIGTALVIYSFEGNVQNSISILENESLSVLERDSGDGWTLVKKLNGDKGYVPTDYIRIVYY